MRIKSLVTMCAFFYGPLLIGLTHFDATPAEAQALYEPSLFDLDEYAVSLSVARPSFQNLNYYSDFYGSPNFFPSLNVTYKLFHLPYSNIGFGGKFSYYTANGRPLRKNSSGDFFADDTSSLTLKILPYEVYAMASIRPFKSRYVTLDVWAGYEELFYEEVRLQNVSTTTAKSNSTNVQSQNEVNDGWNKSLTYGLSLNFLINQFDYQSAKALEKGMGLGYIFIGPFVEFSKTIGGRLFISQQTPSVVEFSRTTYGLLFMFET